MERIWTEKRSPSDYAEAARAFEHTLIDLHFYFIALRNIYRYLEKVIADPAYCSLKPDLELLNDRWFRHYSSAREAFEHIDQRLPGEKHENRIVEIEEQGARRTVHYGLQLDKSLFLHSDEQWDISLATFKKLEGDVEELLSKVVNASCTSLETDASPTGSAPDS